MYQTDECEKCLKDVITEISPQLFKKGDGTLCKRFKMLCIMGLFYSNLMNQEIYQFKRYEYSSLVYTRIDAHDEDEIGDLDTSIHREEYNRLFYNQQASMAADVHKEYISKAVKSAFNPTLTALKPQ